MELAGLYRVAMCRRVLARSGLADAQGRRLRLYSLLRELGDDRLPRWCPTTRAVTTNVRIALAMGGAVVCVRPWGSASSDDLGDALVRDADELGNLARCHALGEGVQDLPVSLVLKLLGLARKKLAPCPVLLAEATQGLDRCLAFGHPLGTLSCRLA